jgi:hypothetical protein
MLKVQIFFASTVKDEFKMDWFIVARFHRPKAEESE